MSKKVLKKKTADVVGLVEAGFSSPAEGSMSGDSLSLDDYVIRNREASFMLKMKGDTMKESGICDGDMIIVERGATPRLRDIVVVRIDGSFALRYFDEIRSGNSESEAVLEAVVVAVVRKYRK